MLDVGETAVLVTVLPSNQTLAADIILIVDESSSMDMEHAWIPDMTRQLDTALQVACCAVYDVHVQTCSQAFCRPGSETNVHSDNQACSYLP